MADALTAPIQRPRHIPSLDGLRALSVLLVIALHTLQRLFDDAHCSPGRLGACQRNPVSISGRLFNTPWIAWIGRLSYSLYVWQTLFLHHNSIEILGHNSWWNTFPGSWVCILAVAIFSFYCIEQPSLRLRDVFLRKMKWHEI